MSEHTPITGDIRRWWELHISGTMDADLREGFGNLCDAIDAIHAGLERENAALKTELDRVLGEQEEAIQQALMGEGGVQATDENMAEHGWVRLPVDGEAPCKQLGEWIEKRGLITGPLDHDGKLWHKGDMSASPWGEIGGIVFDGECWKVCGHDTSAPWLPADSLLHYHAPTVEDVLRDFAQEMSENMGLYVGDAIDAGEWRDADAKTVEKYAKRLTLAEVEDA